MSGATEGVSSLKIISLACCAKRAVLFLINKHFYDFRSFLRNKTHVFLRSQKSGEAKRLPSRTCVGRLIARG